MRDIAMQTQITNAPDLHGSRAAQAFEIRQASLRDVSDIHRLILRLADEEGYAQSEIEVAPAVLQTALFGPDPKALAAVATVDEKVVGVAVCYWTFSTLLGRAGLHLDDLYVLPAYRGSQIGTRMMVHLSKLAHVHGARRFEWWVLSSNQTAMRFYERLGAEPVPEVGVYRLSGTALTALSKSTFQTQEEPA